MESKFLLCVVHHNTGFLRVLMNQSQYCFVIHLEQSGGVS